MNKHLYRIVFNHALGVFQVVSELVRRPGRGATQRDGAVATTVRPVSLGLWVAFGWIGLASVASAQIAGDMQAPGNQRPTVMAAPNNAPLINIQTPSAQGVSRNSYNRFDVGSEGAVLNNSRTNTQTQLAGTIAGNPWLANGTAKVILNEVTGPNPSQLNGYIEVAGDRAQVVIANPSGIACDGCGFINANRVTLTTGVPVLNGGALDGYRVTGGTIQINGKGMDASRADYADIIARAVQVNGGIWAPQLQVTTGANEVKVDPSQASAITADGNKPQFALDVSALGGMYANKIALLGTEHGLGVRNAGNIGAQAGELTVTFDGRLENTGSLQSQGNTQIAASGGVGNAGTISATRELAITTAQDLDNSNGTLNAARVAVDAASMRNAGGTVTQTSAQAIAMQVGALSNRNGGRIGMPDAGAGSGESSGTPDASAGSGGTSTGGSGSGGSTGSSGGTGVTPAAPLADGALHITGLLDNDGGHITAASGFDLVTSNGLANDGGQLALRQLTLTGGDLSNRSGELSVDRASTVHAAQVVNDGGKLSFTRAVAFDAQGLSNRAGSLLLADPAAMTLMVAGTLDNSGGTLATNASQFSLGSAALINEKGAINHAGTDGFSLRTGSWQGAGGTVATAGAASISAGNVDHHGAVLSATQLTLRAVNLDNRGGTIASSGDQTNMLNVVGTLDNGNGGVIQSNGDLFLSAQTLGNAGGTVQHAGQGTLGIRALTLNGNGGTIASNGTLSLTGDTINLARGTTYAQNLSVDAGTLSTAGGSLTALGGGALNLQARDAFDNTQGTVVTNGALQIEAGDLDNTGGKLSAAGHDASSVQVTRAFTNVGGTVATSGATSLHAGTFSNAGGTVQVAGGTLSLSADGLLDNSAKGTLTSDGDLSLSAATLDNTTGTIAHAGTGALTIQAATLNGAGGTVASNGTLSLSGGAINLANGTTYAQSIVLNADSLSTAGGSFTALDSSTSLNLIVRGLFDNTHGTIATNGALQLNAGSLTNTDGNLTAAGTAATNVAVAQTFDNTRGTLAAMGATTIHGGSIINQGGTLQAGGGSTLSVTADGLLDNSAKGTLTSDGDLTVSAATLDNTTGTVAHAGTGALTIQASTLNGAGGTVASNGALSLTGGAINLANGSTYAQSIVLNADTLSTAGGHLTALGGTPQEGTSFASPLNLTVHGLFDNTRGTVATNGALQLSAQSLTNVGGTLTAAGTGATNVTVAQTLDNTGGTLAAMGAITVHGGNVINQGGSLQAGGGSTLTVTADGLLDNSQHGTLASDGDLSIAASTLDNTLGTIQQAGQGALTIHATTLNGQGGTLASNGALTISGSSTNLRGGVTTAQQISIDTGSLVTAGGNLSALGNGVLHLGVSGAMDNSGGHVATNGALQLSAGSLTNVSGSILVAGGGASSLLVTNAIDNAHGTLATTGATTLHAGSLDNTGGTMQAASAGTFTLTTDGQLVNDSGTLLSNGALALSADGVSNHAGAIQAQQGITATVARTLDNSSGALIAGGDMNISAGTVLNRDTVQGGPANSPIATQGIFGNHVQVQADAIDNTRGQIHANDALTLRGRSQAGTALTNAAGVLDGTGAVAVTATTFDNTGGQLIQRGDAGALWLTVSGALNNTGQGMIGAEGSATLQAGAFDNSGGTTYARHDLAITSFGNLLNRSGGLLQTNTALSLTAGGSIDNSGGTVDAAGAATLNAASVANVGGQLLAGNAAHPDATLQVNAGGAVDNRGGSIGNRGGDTIMRVASIDNSGGGKLVAQRNLNLDSLGALNNIGGTVYATGNLSYQNGNAWLDNSGGQFGAGDTTWLTLSSITSANGGHIQTGTLWLNTTTLNVDGGEIDATALHAQVSAINGLGRLYGAQLLDAHINGDYTYAAGQRFESDGVLSLTVGGTLTNQGTLQTQGELDITAANLINQGSINASAGNGGASANINTSGQIDNQGNGRIEADTLTLSASDVTNTGNIVGDSVRISANTLTNGRDLGSAMAAVDYGEGFIGAANAMELHIAQRLDNLDGDLFSGGNLNIAGRADGTSLAALNNVSGRIQGQGNVTINADQLDNRRRVINTATYVLSADEQAANSGSATVAQYKYTDTDPNHQPPAISPDQVVSAAELAKAQAYCDSHNYSSLRCIGYPQGRGSPAVFQSTTTSTLTQVTVITSASADSRIESGGDMVLNGNIRNSASTIAATRNLTINGSGGGDGWASVQNIAWVPTGEVTTSTSYQTQSQYLINSPRTWLDGDWWEYDTSSTSQSVVLTPGNVPSWVTYNVGQGLSASITAGGSLSIGGNVTNTVVGAKGNGGAINAGALAGPGGVTLRGSNAARAGSAGSVDNAHGNAVSGAGSVNGAQGQAVSGAGDVDHAQGQTVNGAGSVNGAQGQRITATSAVDNVQGQAVGGTGSVSRTDGSKVGDAGGARGVGTQSVGSSSQALPGYVPPSNAMYAQNGDPGAPFLVNTAPRFAKGASTSSDYLLKALGDDPSNTQKRLGDGYYEQQLVLDQLLQLTGRRTLNGGDPMAQYTALMNGAASEASRLGLSLGAPLTSSQISALQSDIVWLVDQVVDGQHVLVPVVYLSKATAERLQSDGALLAGDTVNIQSAGTVRNDGTISGTQGTVINADTLINSGTLNGGQQLAIATRNDTINSGAINGGTVSVQAGRDLVSTGAITSTGDMALVAGRDLTVGAAPVQSGGNLAMAAGHDLTATASHISAAGNAQLVAGNNINLDATVHTVRTGGASNGQETTTHAVTDITAGGNLALVAGNDLTSVGAQLKAGNQLGLSAGHDLTLNAVTDSQANYSKSAAGNTVSTTRSDDQTVRGSTLSGTNGVSLVARNDLTATAATVSSTNGAIGLMAGHDLTLNTAQENHSTVTDTKTVNSGMLSSTTKRTHDSVGDSYAIGTTISGDSVSMAAGHDLTATAAQIVADHDIVMAAGNNLTLNTANDVHTEEHGTSKTKSGLMGAGVGVMLGEAKQSQDATLTQTTPTGTTVGSLGGSVTMTAGNNVHLADANVLSDTGTAIVSKNVTIDAAVGSTDTSQTYKQSSSGLTLSLGGAAVDAAMGAYAAAHRGSEVKDDRLKALYAAQAAYGVSDAVDAYNKGGVSKSGTDGGINLQLGIGASSASSKSVSHDETAYGSTIKSNGNVLIAATDGDLNVIGSKISGDNVALSATNNINLLSQAEDHTLKSSNKNASGGVGVQIGTDGIGFYAQASVGKGSAHGNGTTHATTSVDAKDTLTIVSGGDTTLQGAQAKGNTVLANIGGNLNIISEQDTDDYASKQQQASGKLVVGVGASGSGSYNQSKVDSHYASVTTVSGIGAGDGGFNIHVNGNTDLKGGVIASTADPSKNLLDTGSLTFSNIENKANYSASSVGISGGSAGSGMSVSPSVGIPQGDDSHNSTKAGIAGGTIITRNGDTDLSGLDRTANLDQAGLKPIFDLQKVQENQEMGQAAGYVGMRGAGTLSDILYTNAANDLVQARIRGDSAAEADAQQRLDMWNEGGAGKTILHGMVGAATAALGNGDVLGGALGAAASAQASGAMQKYLIAHGIKEGSPEYNSLMQAGSAVIGGALGGGAGANTALAGDSFNRQLHPNEIKLISGDLAAKYAAEHPGVSVSDAETLLMAQALRQVDDTWATKLGAESKDSVRVIDGTYMTDHADVKQWLVDNTPAWAQQAGYFTATTAERADPTINGQYYDAQFHSQLNGRISDLADSFKGLLGDDTPDSPAQHGSLINFSSYQDLVKELRDPGRMMVLEQKVKNAQLLTDQEVSDYLDASVLYPILRAGALGPFGQLGTAIRDEDPGAAAAAVVGVIPGGGLAADAKYAQKTYGLMFSAEGAFAGKSVDDVAAALRSGALAPAEVPINYIVRDGQTIILNTRSAQALDAAGIPRSQWNGVNKTGDSLFEGLLDGQLSRNRGAPFDTVRPSGGK